MGDEIISHDPMSSMADEISSHDSKKAKKEAIEKEWRVWLKAYENQSNWCRDMPCFKKLSNLLYQSVEGECWEIVVEAYEKVSLARKATMPNCKPINQTALHLLVARSTPKEVIEKVLRHINGDDVNIKDEEGNTVFHVAAATKGFENIDICKLILSYFPDLIEECNEDGETPLSLFTRCCFDLRGNDRFDRYEDMINTLNLTKFPPHSTPLHFAVDNDRDAEETFEHFKGKKNMLKMKDEKGNTPLHLVASDLWMKDLCKSMADACPELVNEANCEGKTPLFIAAEYRFFTEKYRILYEYADPNTIDKPRGDGNTILHLALLKENFDWAYQILQKHPSFRSSQNNKDGLTPLKILANNPSAFRSRTPLTMVEHIIYSCIWVVDLEKPWKSEVDYCRQELSECFNTFKRLITSDLEKPDHEHIIRDEEIPVDSEDVPTDSKSEDVPTVSESDIERTIMELIKSFFKKCMVPIKSFIKKCMAPIKSFIKTCMASIKIIVSFLFKHILPGKLVRKIENIKRRHMLSYKIMEKLLLNYETSREDPVIGNATILIAAEKGVTEMVEGIFGINDRVGWCTSETDLKSALLLAIENRQADVYELLTNLKKKGIFMYDIGDHEGNNPLHLAATRSSRQPWGMPTTMQLLWEIKWYNYVRDTMPTNRLSEQNNVGKTPSQVFWEEHKDLLQKNDLGQWLNTTSQSCSVVAGLVATVAYSSATTTPGGNSQEGVHNFKGNPAFGTFVISAFMALCFSLISLVMFLSILISPYRGLDDANKILPRKLVVALSALLLSTGTMFISFCAGHFFFLEGKLTYAASPFYSIGCLLVGLILVTQFDSYTSLLSSMSRSKPRPWYDDDSLLPQLPPKS